MMKYSLRRPDDANDQKYILFVRIFFVLTIFLLFISGCSPTEPDFPAAPKSGTMLVRNYSSESITVFTIRKSGTEQWGTNYLQGGYYLPSGYPMTVFVPVGDIDIRLESVSPISTWTFTNYRIEESGNYTLDITD